jgi:NADH:ubiquinone oxidoreductase subunit 4 (subunit M)
LARTAGAALFALTIAILWMGIYPAPITRLVQSLVAH